MRSNVALLLLGVIICVGFCVLVGGLKCQTEDGPTEEDVKRVVRVCMRKIGEELDEESNDYEDNEEEAGQDNYRSRNRDHLRGRQGRYKRSAYRNQERSRSTGYGHNNNQSNYERRTEYDRSCLIHCFFQEMKMTNDDDFPDKHKVLYVLTKELRDRQLKDFFTDSIQECFHILEMDQRRYKCEFARNLIFCLGFCLGERAKTNCDDWNDNTVLF